MADERLRELERRFRQTGDLVDEVHYLREALRRGAIEEERLSLAACLGAPAARVAMGESEADATTPAPLATAPAGRELPALERLTTFLRPVVSPIELWALQLNAYGEDVAVRAAIAAARMVLPRWDWHLRTSEPYPQDIPGPQDYDDRPRLAVEAAEAWVIAPCPQRVRGATQARASVLAALEGTFFSWVMDAASAAASAANLDPDPPVDHEGRLPIVATFRAAMGSEVGWQIQGVNNERESQQAWDAVYPLVDRRLRAATAAEVVPWALGYDDPLLARASVHGT